MKSAILFLFFCLFIQFSQAQSWNDVGGGTNNSSHGMLTWDNKLVNLGSFNNPCNRVALWNGTTWECLGGGVGIVARAGTIWNGNLVVVGDFWNVQLPCTNCKGIAMWDGTQWTNIGAGFNNDVLCVTVWNGDLVAAGDFTQSNGQPCSRIARWTGTTWEQIGPDNAFNNDIRAITEFEGELWVGGDFSNVGGCTACDGLVKWNGSAWVGGNSGVDLSGGVDTTVRVLYTSPTDGRLYMGGHFRGLTPNGVYNANLNGVAVYDGSDWFALGNGIGDNPDDYVRAISEYNGSIVVGGYFTTASGIPAQKIARFNLTTQTWSAMGQGFDGIGVDEYVKSSAVWNGILFAGGAYTQAEGGPMDYVAQWYEPPVTPPLAVINAEQNSICAGACASFTDNSTYSPTSWNWSFPGAQITSSTLQNPPPICYNTPGTYTITLQACNSNGCNTTTKTLTVNSATTLSVNNPTVCSGSSTLLTANPNITGGTFLWSPGGETTNSITVSPTVNTSYSVTYTSTGCGSASATSTVTVVSAPTVTANDASICEGTNATLTAVPSVSGGQFEWSPGGESTASIVVDPLSTTSYTVVYSLGNCSSSPYTSTVTVNPTPSVTVNNSTICNGQSTTLSATPSTGNGSYLWSPGGENTQDITVNPTSTSSYTVTYTLNGCSSLPATSNVVVNVVPSVTVNDLTLCLGSSGNIIASPSASGGNYLWSPNGEMTQTISVSPTVNSNYSVVYTLNGCSSNPSISTVSVVTPPTVSSNDATICSGNDATLTASPSIPGGSFSWTPGGNTNEVITVNPTETTSYTVTYTISGCPGATSTSTVTVNPIPVVTLTDAQICEGDQTTLTATPSIAGGSFSWSPTNETSNAIVVNPSTTSSYTVTYTLNNCSSVPTTSTVTVLPTPIATITLLENTLEASQNGAEYQWIDCDNGNQPITSATNQQYTVTTNGNYACIINLNGCSITSDCINVNVNDLEEMSSTQITIYPNPSSDFITITSTSDLIGTELSIKDLQGKTVDKLLISNEIMELDIKKMDSGIYFITIQDGHKSNFRFIKL